MKVELKAWMQGKNRPILKGFEKHKIQYPEIRTSNQHPKHNYLKDTDRVFEFNIPFENYNSILTVLYFK